MLRHLLFCFFVMYGSFVFSQHGDSVTTTAVTPGLKGLLERVKAEEALLVWLVFKVPTEDTSFVIVAKYKGSNSFLVRLKASALKEQLKSGRVAFADKYEKPLEELTTGSLDLATNRANHAHQSFPDIGGQGILISVKENSLDTADIDLFNRYKRTGVPSPLVTAHASIMATTIAGGGNSSPEAKGVAYAGTVTSSDFSILLPEEGHFYSRHGITVQNHSYGTVVQPYYGAEALAYDVSSAANPRVVFVFSAGNSGTATPASGSYSGIAGFSNLTGNFKGAKNIITVGAIDSFYAVSPLSSAGPAYDGRVKPELVAFGEDGSSGAAAMVSGAAALVQQAYQKMNNNSLPSASLVKAVLVNSADEIGTPGPDFRSGYGSLNVHDAVATVLDGRTGDDSLVEGEKKLFTITIPEGSAELKVTLAWTDRPAGAGAAKALVNDLNAKLISASGISWQPWILSHAPHRDSLQLPAKRGVDTLNTLEQIFIQNPAAGTYTFEVYGASVIGNQPFSFAYQVRAKDNFTWTYPRAADPVESGGSAVVRWQTTKSMGATLQWSPDGNAWTTIATGPALQSGFAKWDVPLLATIARIRMLFPDGSSALSDSFVISPVLQLKAGYDCVDSFLLHWNKRSVNDYSIYELKGNYLQPFSTQKDTFRVLTKGLHPLPYYAVAPLIGGKEGKRSFTLNYKGAGAGCYVNSFFLQTQTATEATFQFSLGTTYGIQNLTFQKFMNGAYQNLTVIATLDSLEYSFADDGLRRGENRYRVQIILENGQTVLSEVITVYHLIVGSVLLYPNPVAQSGAVNIVTSKAGRITLHFIDITGRSVVKFRLRDLSQTMQLSSLPRGVYFVRITEDDGGSSTQKLVIY